MLRRFLNQRWLLATAIASSVMADANAQTIPNPLVRSNEAPAAASPVTPAEPPVEAKRAKNAELLRVAQRRLDEAGSADAAAAEQVALYKTVETVLAQQEAVDEQINNLTARQQDLETQLQSPPTADAEKSISFLEFDRLNDELSAEERRAKSAAAKLSAAKAALEAAQASFNDSEKARLRAQEALSVGREGENAAALATAADQAVQASRLAGETVTLRKKEVQRDELGQQVQKLAQQLIQQKVDRAAPRVTFAKADLEGQLHQIKKQEETLTTALQRAQNNLPKIQRQLSDARRQLDAATGDKTVPTEQLATAQRAYDKLDTEIQLLTQRLAHLNDSRLAWNRRYQLATRDQSSEQTTGEAKPVDDVKSWQTETKSKLSDLSAESRSQINRMAELRGDLATVSKKADTAKDGPAELAPLIEAQRRHLEDTLRLHEANLVAIETSRRVHERLQSEVGRGLDALSPKQIARSAWDRAKAVWTYPFGEIEGQTIDVGRVVRGLITFIIGWIVARILATLIVHRLLKRFRLSKDASAAIKTLLFYGLLVVATLIALKVINIPLTAFTILGGALAIGVGFGSQAIFNNFLSGLIMLAERPVRIGERIVFGNYDGTVEEVGFRSTKVRTLTDHLVTIPNSNLINEPIENIGRRRTIRRIIQVTITYDTPREKIVEAVQVIRDVLDEPGIREPIHPVIGWDKFPPRVFFNDYNAESLNIQVVYWFAPPEYWDYMEHCQKVNLRIYEEFERLGVDFAFPSRTLYLAGDAKRELAVRLSSNGSQSHDAA